jgi:hypothetical protein
MHHKKSSKKSKNNLSFNDFQEKFSTEEACRESLSKKMVKRFCLPEVR